ncbi:MAG: hypothetical protein M3N33_04545 [Actinomycetota bacterium]|nr:hypothetical protein [Actinomycetota bacterium]
MSAAQEQAVLLGSLCLVTAVVIATVMIFSRVSRFGVFATANFLFAAALFWTQVAYGFSGWRSEIVAAATSELPGVLLVCWVCLAQVGGLPGRLSPRPIGPVIQRPRLRRLLWMSAVVLPVAWICGTIVGLMWPSPAMQAYASAPIQFLLFKWPISVSQGAWAGLAAIVFALAAMSPASAAVLRLRNGAFALSMLAFALVAAESTAFAGVRLWADEERRGVLEFMLGLEAALAALCFAALGIGLALRYTPSVATTVLGKMHTAWIPARERFESFRWRVSAGGGSRGVIRASYILEEAARLARLPKTDSDKALAAIQLLAVMKDPSAETGRVTPAAARDLYEMQEELSRDDVLWTKIGAAMRGRSGAGSSRAGAPGTSQEALRVALDLIEPTAEPQESVPRPLWSCLVAVAAGDAGLVDPAVVRGRFGSHTAFDAASKIYEDAKGVMRSRTLRGP